MALYGSADDIISIVHVIITLQSGKLKINICDDFERNIYQVLFSRTKTSPFAKIMLVFLFKFHIAVFLNFGTWQAFERSCQTATNVRLNGKED